MSEPGSGEIMLHRCGSGAAPRQLPARSKAHPGGGITIDLHCHTFSDAIEAMVADHPEKVKEQARLSESVGAASLEINNRQWAVLMPKMTSLEVRLDEMDRMGVDVQVVSPNPTQYYYWAEPDVAGAIVSTYNDYIAEACAKAPGRVLGFGTVSLQHPELAAAQLDHAIRKLGFYGVEISSLVEGRDIADPMFDPFWAKADELGAVVFIHPWGTSLGDRVSQHYLGNIIGQPIETTLALSHLIFGGTFDRYPGLKVLAAHGGGYLPLYISRSDRGHAVRSEAQGCLHKPSDYLRRNIWCDCVVFEPDHLKRLVDVVGSDRVVVGTDYPFGKGMGSFDVHPLVAELDEETRTRILGGNAAALLGLDLVERV